MKKLFIISLLLMVLASVVPVYAATTEVDIHPYDKFYKHRASAIEYLGAPLTTFLGTITPFNPALYYTSSQVDTKLSDKADTDSVYTKSAMNILLALKASVAYVDGTDETTIASLNTQISRYNATGSSGTLAQPNITDNGTGGIYISPFTYAIKTADSDTAELAYFTVADTVEIASGDLDDNSMNWLYVDYNAGTPRILQSVSYSTIRTTDQFLIGFLWKSGTTLKIVSHGKEIPNFTGREEERLYARGIVERMSGAVIGEKATRYVTMTEGIFYTGISRVVRTAQDSQTDGFDSYWSYNSGTGVWTNRVATYPNQIDNDKYNKISDGTLTPLTVNRYGVHWIYICGDGSLQVVFGQGDYTLTNAQASKPPSTLPPCMANLSVLLGRVIIKKGATVFTQTDSAFNVTFSPSGVQDHNDLANRNEAGAHEATAVSYTDTYTITALTIQEAIDTLAVQIMSTFPATYATISSLASYLPLSTIQAAGDLIVGTGSGAVGRISIGANGTVLSSNGTTASWQTPSAGVTKAYVDGTDEVLTAAVATKLSGLPIFTPLSMANADYTGEVIIDTVAASQTVYNVVYSSSTGWAAAKADAGTTLPALGVALETGTGDKKILLRGIVRNTSWSFTKGALIYVSTATAGAITAVKPSTSGNRVQPIGVALSETVVFFNPTNMFWEL